MPEQYDEKPQVQQVAQIINGVFSQLLATFPASLANRDQNEVNEIRRQWVLAFRENGITTMEQVNAGMRVARRQNRPFLPSPGQFVAWCREEASVTAGLPNVSELVDMVYEYCRKRGLYPDAESYPWKSNAHYWLVTNLYQNMRANALTDAELRRKAADELVHMTARINRGEAIPEPVKQLPVMGGRPLNRAQALAKIAEIKAKFGLKGAITSINQAAAKMARAGLLVIEAHQQNAIHAVQQILPDPTKPIVVTIQERNRSLDQNRKLWACLGDVSRQVEWHGRWLDAESWKCVFTAALKQQDVVPNLAGNGFVVIGQSTSRMRVGEFAELLELIQAFGTERGVKWSDEARLALEWKARWGDRAA
ncbi:replication protein P [Trichophyton mentagrophytes]|nr:replication protein P [Trichophyton mentagrophytes]